MAVKLPQSFPHRTVFLFFTLCLIPGGRGPVSVALASSSGEKHLFTTFPNLMKLYYIEEECLGNVDVFLREELMEHGDMDEANLHHNLTEVRKLVEEAKKVHREVGSKTKEFLSHPVNVYHLVRRLRDSWKSAIELIRHSTPCRKWDMPQLMARLANLEDNLPKDDEFNSVASNLLHIQHFQGIPTKQLVGGIVGGHKSIAPISLQEQFRIAKLAVEEDDYFYAAQWLKHMSKNDALKRMTRAEDGFNATNVLGMLSSALYSINMVPDALKAVEELLQKDSENMVARNNKAFYEDKVSRGGSKVTSALPKTRYNGKEDEYRRKYESLCRGTTVKPRRLKCRLEPTWPGSRVSFYKMEVLSRKPPIIAYHDVISRHDADLVIDIAEDEYEKAAMDTDEGYKMPEFTLVLSRVAETRKMTSKQSARFSRALRRINKALSELPHAALPPYLAGESEVRNFGHQGFYFKPYPDFQVHTMGGHTVTLMAFLNDVEMGGEVVFPASNTRVIPQLGTVVAYFPSMKKVHSTCPVAYGTEWILIRSFFEKRATTWCRPHDDPELVG